MTNRELDAAIAEALGEQVCRDETCDGDCGKLGDTLQHAFVSCGDNCIPRYHDDPVAAVALMRALRDRGLCIVLNIDERPAATVMREGCADCDVFEAAGDTWTLALAKAALSALTAGKP